MSKLAFRFAFVILVSMPCMALADGYPVVPSPPIPKAASPGFLPRQVFHWLDTNHDGFLTLDEFLAAPWVKNVQPAKKFFYWMDTNHDGLVSLDEFLAAFVRYCSGPNENVRITYPGGWTYWRPWRYGWYWHNGWHRKPGVWRGYANRFHFRGGHTIYNPPPRHYANASYHPHGGHPHHPAKHFVHRRPVKHVHHETSSRPHGNHRGHGHPGSHAHRHR